MAEEGLDESSFFWSAFHFVYQYFLIFVRWLLVKIYDVRGQSMPPIDDRLLLEPATSIAELIRTKQMTSTQVIKAFIRRIKQINPLLNCVVDERYKDALEEAAEVDKLIASNEYTVDELRKWKPFLGVPVSTKNFIGVKGLVQSSGIWRRRNIRSTEDAEVIRLMRNAGAIPFVVTNVPELCMWYESANKINGRTRNPYDTNRTTGGSSGGECSLLAAGGCPIGIGSDLGGSIRVPAYFCGVFGHKPSPYVVPLHGKWPPTIQEEKLFANSIGPITRFACDLKPTLMILAGEKAKELNLDEPVDLMSLKYFYQENDGGNSFVLPVEEDVRIGMEKVIQYFQSGLKVNPKRVQFDKLRNSMTMWMAVLTSKTHEYESLLVNNEGKIHTYTELLKWFIGQSEHTLPGLINSVQEKIGVQYGTAEHKFKVKQCDDLKREFQEMLGENGVFFYPTHPTVAPFHNEAIVRGYNLNMCYTAIFNVLGLPCTTVPLGLGKEGLPIGIQVVANRNQDRLCLAVACELERAFGGWVPPEIIA